jgi:hypothetical protein
MPVNNAATHNPNNGADGTSWVPWRDNATDPPATDGYDRGDPARNARNNAARAALRKTSQ